MSYRIMKVAEGMYGLGCPYIVYRAACDCESVDHDITIDLEFDPESCQVMMEFYKKLEWNAYWGAEKWYQKFWNKVKATFKMWFKGYIELEESFIFGDEDQMLAFAGAIVKGSKQIRENREAWEMGEKLGEKVDEEKDQGEWVMGH